MLKKQIFTLKGSERTMLMERWGKKTSRQLGPHQLQIRHHASNILQTHEYCQEVFCMKYWITYHSNRKHNNGK